MQLFLSLSKWTKTTHRILQKRDKYCPTLRLENVLINAVNMRGSTLAFLDQNASEIQEIMVDCGSFLVQQGRLKYSQVLVHMKKARSKLATAHWYVLPDQIPLTQDDPSIVEKKVEQTITSALKFADECEDYERCKLLPVVHGRKVAHFEKCVRAYATMGVRRIGFGSLVTNGPSNGVNSLSRSKIDRLAEMLSLANKYGLEVHLFGVSGPTHLLISNLLGVTSIDSSAWNRIAGYGLIYLPFLRSFHITDVARKSKSYTLFQINQMALMACPDFEILQHHVLKTCMYSRSLQNWKALHYMMENMSSSECLPYEAIERFSPRNAKLLRYAEECIRRVIIRKAKTEDKEAIINIARTHYKELGYIREAELERALKREDLIVAELLGKVIGFQEYRHLKRQPVTRLYHKAVLPRYRRRGVGTKLVQFVISEARSLGRRELTLKCVEDLPANIFHKKCGFRFVAKEAGKRRALNVYSLRIPISFQGAKQ